MKRNVILILLLSFLLLLSACAGVGDGISLQICGAYGVPGMFASDTKGPPSRCEVYERDSCGRILFSYTEENFLSGKQEKAMVICQKITDEDVWFYEDLCYTWSDSAESIESLKLANDWERPLDDARMSHRPIKVTLDLVIRSATELDYDRVKAACRSALRPEEEELSAACYADYDSNGKELYFVETGSGRLYAAVVSERYEVSLLRMDALRFDRGALAAFKQKNGWCYPAGAEARNMEYVTAFDAAIVSPEVPALHQPPENVTKIELLDTRLGGEKLLHTVEGEEILPFLSRLNRLDWKVKQEETQKRFVWLNPSKLLFNLWNRMLGLDSSGDDAGPEPAAPISIRVHYKDGCYDLLSNRPASYHRPDGTEVETEQQYEPGNLDRLTALFAAYVGEEAMPHVNYDS